MENKKTINKYLLEINSQKELTKLFGIIPYPGEINIPVTILIIFCVFVLEIIFNTFLILPLLSLIFLIENYSLTILRTDILDLCLVYEIIYENDAKKNLNYLASIGESDEINDCDRLEIFEDNFIHVMSNQSFLSNLKNYYEYYFIIFLSYSLFLFLLMLRN